MDRLGSVDIKQVFREQNQVADILAKEGAKKEDVSNTTIFVVPLAFVEQKLVADTLGTSHARKTNFDFQILRAEMWPN